MVYNYSKKHNFYLGLNFGIYNSSSAKSTLLYLAHQQYIKEDLRKQEKKTKAETNSNMIKSLNMVTIFQKDNIYEIY